MAGCGDDEGGGEIDDGGLPEPDDEDVPPPDDGGIAIDLDEVQDRIDSLLDSVGDLGGDVTDLADDLSNLSDDLDDLTSDLQDRLDSLENPEVLSCSVEEVCIPDGVVLTETSIAPIVQILCEHEIDCCSPAELNLKFGPAITTAAQCETLFTDVVNNGLSPDFLEASPQIIEHVIAVAQALNDPDVRVQLSADGIEECVDWLQGRECPEYAAVEPGAAVCVESQLAEPEVCALGNLLIGLQQEGELCGAYDGGYGDDAIPECERGLYCSWEGSQSNPRGICAKLPEEGDGCLSDHDCDPASSDDGSYGSTLLYCNIATAQCAAMSAEGEACAFINPDFSISDSGLDPTQRSATSRDCLPHLRCSPLTNKCVTNCDEGFLCSTQGDPFYKCSEGRVCNVTELPKLLESYDLGVCTGALSEGDTCTPGFRECDDRACIENCNLDTDLCTCGDAPLLQPGDDCDAPGSDPLCVTGMCGSDSTCAGFCDCEEGDERLGCDWVLGERGREAETCGDDSYCDFGAAIEHAELGYGYACKPLINNGGVCDLTTAAPHLSCASGFCDPDPADDGMGPINLCSPKVALNASCTTLFDEECPSTQFCNNGTCATKAQPLEEGDECDTTDAAHECAARLFCDHPAGESEGTCEPQKRPGEACKPHLNGNDCINGVPNSCVFTKEQFLCNASSQPEETLFCDGNG